MMFTRRLRSRIGPDGILRLEVPTPYRDTDVEVEIIFQPVNVHTAPSTPEAHGWPPGFFEQTAGAWAGERLVRGPQGNYEERQALD